jgi:Subunit ChlI of Mg-chelatase
MDKATKSIIHNINVVGLPDKAVSEARERVRAALVASGLALPARRITVIYQTLKLTFRPAIVIDIVWFFRNGWTAPPCRDRWLRWQPHPNAGHSHTCA